MTEREIPMSDPIVMPPAGVTAENPTAASIPAQNLSPNLSPPPSESNPLRQLRDQYDANRAELKATQAKLVELEAAAEESRRARMDEIDRLRLEADEGKQAKVQAARLSEVASALYEDELKAVPDDKRENLRTLTFMDGDPAMSLTRLKAAKQLLPPSTVPAGTVTNPATQSGATAPSSPEISMKDPLHDYFTKYAPSLDRVTANTSDASKIDNAFPKQ